jgi:DNA-binding response OmpR family regulator
MKVLLIETKKRLAPGVRESLLAEGFVLDIVRGAAHGITAAVSRDYDVIVLTADRSLEGYDLPRELRRRQVWTPVLMLEDLDGPRPGTDTFHLTVPEYLTRPTSFVTVIARLWGLVRHQPDQPEGVLAVGSLTLDPARRVVERGGVAVALSAREYTLLMFLMRHAGDVVSKAQILQDVWSSTRGGENLVEVYIGYLRKKLDAPFHVQTLHTVRGLGYRLDPDTTRKALSTLSASRSSS